MTDSEGRDAAARIEVNQDTGTLKDRARQIGVEVGEVAGNLVVQVSAPTARRLHSPPRARRNFYGREVELAEVVASLEVRDIVILHGMAGIGKTALAAEASRELFQQEAFPDGVLWVSELGNAPISAVCDAIARQLRDDDILRLPAERKPDATRELLATYNDQLVVLDSLNDLQSARAFVEICLPPDVALLITSRMRLSLYAVDVLLSQLDPEAASLLFKDRVGHSEVDLSVVEVVCELLDYHPLALEIAAAPVRFEGLPLRSLLQRLQDDATRLNSLHSGAEEGRRQPLWGWLHISHEKLNPEARQVFECLAGGFGKRTSLELLARATSLSRSRCEVLVGRLVRQSLVERSDGRISLQGLVRDFGRSRLGDRLSVVQAQVANAAHAFLDEYAESTPGNHDRLEEELPNLLGAIHFAAEAGEWETVLEMAKALVRPVTGVLGVRGYWSELVTVGELSVEAAKATGDERSLLRLKNNLATIYAARGEIDRAKALHLGNLAAAEVHGDFRVEAWTLHNLGMQSHVEGRYDEARDYLQRSLEIKMTRFDDHQATSTTLHELGRLAAEQGRYGEALRLFQDSLEVDKEFQDLDGIASNQLQIGMIQQIRGAYQDAVELYDLSLQVYREELRDKDGVAFVEHALGSLHRLQGDYEEAQTLLEQSLATSRALGFPLLVATNLFMLGALFTDTGDYARARRCLEESLSISVRLGHRRGMADARLRLGVVAIEEQRYEEARELLRQSLDLYGTLGIRKKYADTLYELAVLHQALNERTTARSLYRKSLQIHRELGHRFGIGRSHWRLGQLAQLNGDLEAARSLYMSSLEAMEELGSPYAEKIRTDMEILGSI